MNESNETKSAPELTGSEPATQQPAAPQPPALPRVSAMLVAAREAKGMSQKAVADELFLTTSVIRYLEEGEFDKIPKRAFVKGYLRSFARVVALDGNIVVAAYDELAPVKPPVKDINERADPNLASNLFTGPVFQTGLFGLAALIVVLLGVWLLSDDSAPPRVTAPASEVISAPDAAKPLRLPERSGIDEPAEKPGSLDEEIQTSATPGVEAERERQPAAIVDAAMVEELGADAFEVEYTRERLDDGVLVTANAGGSDGLQFSFTDECWVEITDAGGNALFGDLLRAGDRLQVYGDAPFDVLFGRAPAVTLAVNGRAYDLAPHISADNTAKITVGP